jgi:hypothetical protein
MVMLPCWTCKSMTVFLAEFDNKSLTVLPVELANFTTVLPATFYWSIPSYYCLTCAPRYSLENHWQCSELAKILTVLPTNHYHILDSVWTRKVLGCAPSSWQCSTAAIERIKIWQCTRLDLNNTDFFFFSGNGSRGQIWRSLWYPWQCLNYGINVDNALKGAKACANYNYNVYIYNKLSLSGHACKIQLCKLYIFKISFVFTFAQRCTIRTGRLLYYVKYP